MDTLFTQNNSASNSANCLPQRIKPEELNSFNIPVGASVVIYDVASRKALFFKKNDEGYHHILTRNKRAGLISIRKNDYVLTLGFDRKLRPGDNHQVFQRKIAVNQSTS